MKYAVLIYGLPDAFAGMSDLERQAVYRGYMDLIGAPGVYGSEQLAPAATATTVHRRAGEMLITDGPFAEMKEFFGGFYLLDVADREAALSFAARVPTARMGGAVEVRPIVEHGHLVPSRIARSSSARKPSPTKEGTVKYALLIYDDPAGWQGLSEDERNAVFGEYFAVYESPGVYGGAQLQPVETATTVRVEDGRVVTTDGPFVEMKEFLGGYYLLEAENLDAALQAAARIPAARMGGAIEVRPIVER
jgi:hypothetical protein